MDKKVTAILKDDGVIDIEFDGGLKASEILYLAKAIELNAINAMNKTWKEDGEWSERNNNQK